MILGHELTLFIYVLLAALFALLRRRSDALALGGLVAVNVLILFQVNPVLLLYLVAQLALVGGLYRYLSAADQSRSPHWAWLAFLGLLPPNLIPWAGGLDRFPLLVEMQRVTLDGVSWRLGSIFFVIRSYIVLREALALKVPTLLPALASLTFLPAFSAGPVCGSQPWAPQNLAAQVRPGDVLRSVMRFGWGAAALYVVAPRLRRLGASAAELPLGDLADVYLSFAALYFDFSGYTAMALAMAALFGVRLPENFDKPYLATSVREFWRRWHISLSSFVAQYLLKPLVRRFGSRWLGITVAFLFTGMWHQLSWPYLIWGLAHGLALAASLREWPALQRMAGHLPHRIVTLSSWAATMTFVASISYFVQRATNT